MGKLERWSAWALLINGGLGLAVSVGRATLVGPFSGLIESPPWISLLGVVAGILALRGALVGLAGGILFYALQIISYYSRDFRFNFKSGISYAAVVQLPEGVLVLNLVALAGLAVIVLLLARRRLRN